MKISVKGVNEFITDKVVAANEKLQMAATSVSTAIKGQRGDAKALITLLGLALAAAIAVGIIITVAPSTTNDWIDRAKTFVDDKLGW